MSSASPAAPVDPPRRKPRYRTIIRWVAVGAVFVFLAKRFASDWGDLQDENLHFDMVYMAASVVLLLVYMLARAYAWHHLTKLLDVDIPRRAAVTAWLWSQLGKYLPGKVFLFLGRLDFYTREGRPAGPVALGFGIELIGSFASSVITIILGVVTLDSAELDKYRWLMVLSLVVFLVILHPVPLGWCIRLMSRLVRRKPFEVTLSYLQMLWFVFLFTAIWFIFGLGFFALVNSFTSVGIDKLVFLAGAFSLASMVGMLAFFVPSGIGVREGILAVLLGEVMTGPLALACSVVSRIWFTVAEVGLALLAAAVTHIPKRSFHALKVVQEVEHG